MPTEDTSYKIIRGRRWLKVAQNDGDSGYASARWFKDMQSGEWYPAESWKRPNLRYRLTAEQVAYVESLLPSSDPWIDRTKLPPETRAQLAPEL